MKFALLSTFFFLAFSGCFAATEVAEDTGIPPQLQYARVDFIGDTCEPNESDIEYFKRLLPTAYNIVHGTAVYQDDADSQAFINSAGNVTTEEVADALLHALVEVGAAVKTSDEEGDVEDEDEDEEGSGRRLNYKFCRYFFPYEKDTCKKGGKHYTSIRWPFPRDYKIKYMTIRDCKRPERKGRRLCRMIWKILKYVPYNNPFAGHWPRWWYMDWNPRCATHCFLGYKDLPRLQAEFEERVREDPAKARRDYNYWSRQYYNARRLGKGKGKDMDKKGKKDKGKEESVQAMESNYTIGALDGLPGDTETKHEEFELFLANLLRAAPSGCWKNISGVEIEFPEIPITGDGQDEWGPLDMEDDMENQGLEDDMEEDMDDDME